MRGCASRGLGDEGYGSARGGGGVFTPLEPYRRAKPIKTGLFSFSSRTKAVPEPSQAVPAFAQRLRPAGQPSLPPSLRSYGGQAAATARQAGGKGGWRGACPLYSRGLGEAEGIGSVDYWIAGLVEGTRHRLNGWTLLSVIERLNLAGFFGRTGILLFHWMFDVRCSMFPGSRDRFAFPRSRGQQNSAFFLLPSAFRGGGGCVFTPLEP